MQRFFSAMLMPTLLTALTVAAGVVADARAITPEQVVVGADDLYRQRIQEGRARYEIDANAAFLSRVQRIADRLIDQAKRESPWAKQLNWEIHTTTAVDESASCMAGGKLLIGMPYVERLALTDPELAMLLSHEIEHALNQHNYLEILAAQKLDATLLHASIVELERAVDSDQSLIEGLSVLNRNQEFDADREGLQLAWRAGWRLNDLAGFFKKLVRADRNPNSADVDHPSSSLRWQRVRDVVQSLDTSGTSP